MRLLSLNPKRLLTFATATFGYRKNPETKIITRGTEDHYSVDLSIIVPAYNEEPFIGKTLDSLAVFLERFDLGVVEVIVVAADGTDNTTLIAETKENLFQHFLLVRPGPRIGKGRDVREGMLVAATACSWTQTWPLPCGTCNGSKRS